ncbi:MAG: hypothetical protein H0U65_05655 [Rubrobacter sp.]|jgi:hypothetical protein|nr:hypothetical protein [Rubrobacter sp.]
MRKKENGEEFPELFALIESYAREGGEREAMALKVIGGAYLPSHESRGLGDAKRVVDGILDKHGYFVEHGESGGLHPQSVYAVLNVAKHGGMDADLKWGASRLFRIMEALGKRAGDGESYPKHAADAALVSASLAQLAGAAHSSRVHITSMN